MKENIDAGGKMENLWSKYFLKPDHSNLQGAVDQIATALKGLSEHFGLSPMYPKHKGIPSIDQIIAGAELPQDYDSDPGKTLKKLGDYLQGRSSFYGKKHNPDCFSALSVRIFCIFNFNGQCCYWRRCWPNITC